MLSISRHSQMFPLSYYVIHSHPHIIDHILMMHSIVITIFLLVVFINKLHCFCSCWCIFFCYHFGATTFPISASNLDDIFCHFIFFFCLFIVLLLEMRRIQINSDSLSFLPIKSFASSTLFQFIIINRLVFFRLWLLSLPLCFYISKIFRSRE